LGEVVGAVSDESISLQMIDVKVEFVINHVVNTGQNISKKMGYLF